MKERPADPLSFCKRDRYPPIPPSCTRSSAWSLRTMEHGRPVPLPEASTRGIIFRAPFTIPLPACNVHRGTRASQYVFSSFTMPSFEHGNMAMIVTTKIIQNHTHSSQAGRLMLLAQNIFQYQQVGSIFTLKIISGASLRGIYEQPTMSAACKVATFFHELREPFRRQEKRKPPLRVAARGNRPLSSCCKAATLTSLNE